ncbi:SET domain-containing protein [Lentinula edodes]|uniref:SET domain-containing protein n=1 Tax=Lentinula edodes TaxID=5353 RepID=UPI001E8EB3D5|nr:SET domain-containing protein [Lentinula edodes]KAH7877122.1 SET domain-containing protein [Lentinula edodes]
MASEDPNATALKVWLTQNNGYFDPNTGFCKTNSGFSIIAKTSLAAESTIVTTPFSLAITRKVAAEALVQILKNQSAVESWNERQCIASYLCFHHILNGESLNLRHRPYVQTLPTPDQLRTGLFLSSAERELFQGTNLYGAIQEREQEWKSDWNQCHNVVAGVEEAWARAFTWELYLTSASHISSRAFPSTLLSKNPSLLSSPSTEPILLPGIDSLNHARGQPVSWVVTYPNELNQTPEPCISLILHSPTPAGSELFNNYGAKPNSELILGYGFSLAENPDDTIILKIGGGGSDTKKWEIGRSSRGEEGLGAEGLWTEVLSLISQDTTYNYEDELDASSMLGEMIRSVIEKLPTSKRSLDPGQIRPDVIEMFRNYLEGQRDILDSLLAFVNAKEQSAIEKARSEGVDIVLED